MVATGETGSPPVCRRCPYTHTLGREAVVRAFKIVDIGVSTAVYCLAAIGCIICITRLAGPPDPAALRRRGAGALLTRIILRLWLAAVLAYVVRNVWHLVPMPWEGVCGYRHMRVKEVFNSAVFTACMVTYDSHIQAEVLALKERLGMTIPAAPPSAA